MKTRLVALVTALTLLGAPMLSAHAEQPPSVVITTENGHVYLDNSNPVIEGTASGPNGGVRSVRLRLRTAVGFLYAEYDADLDCDSAGTSCVWSARLPDLPLADGVNPRLPGEYRVRAEVLDVKGGWGSSSSITIYSLAPQPIS